MKDGRKNGNPIKDEYLNRVYRKTSIEHWRVISGFLMLYDALAVNVAFFCGLWLRFDFQYSLIPQRYLTAFFKFAPWYTVICLAVFWFAKLYRSVWRFASFNELTRILLSSIVTAVVQIAGTLLFVRRDDNRVETAVAGILFFVNLDFGIVFAKFISDGTNREGVGGFGFANNRAIN